MDIIFFAAIAVFIFFKLKEQLGKVDDGQKKEWKKRNAIKDFIKERTTGTNQSSQNPQKIQSKIVSINGDDFIANQEPENLIDTDSQKILDGLSEEFKPDLVHIMEKSNLSVAQFMFGAKNAFEIILNAFAEGDLKTLKTLLSEKIFSQFESEINNRIKNQQSLNIKIISIDEAQISNVKIINNFFQITISFASKQINHVSDQEGNIVGSKTEISSVADVWTFQKDRNSKDLNWLLSSTS